MILNYFCSRMSFKKQMYNSFQLDSDISGEDPESSFTLQLGFLSICAILWVISGFTSLKKHYIKCKSAGAEGQKGNVVSL